MAADFSEVHRKDVSEYPILALREAIINALLHMDYASLASMQMTALVWWLTKTPSVKPAKQFSAGSSSFYLKLIKVKYEFSNSTILNFLLHSDAVLWGFDSIKIFYLRGG